MNILNKIPKIELHIHLDGSLDLEYVKKTYHLSDETIKEKMVANEKCKNLNDYLTKFDFPISILQTKSEIENAIVNLLNKLKSQNVIYTEIRFAPQFHTKKGLTQEEIVKTAIMAKEKVDIKSNFILCLMRGSNNMKENYETLEIAKKYLGKGVCAIDLAGAEALYKTADYKEIFEKARNYQIPFTIHAGEADGPKSIQDAINFGAKRIGHGVRCIEDNELIKEIIAKNITLEVCPTSNIQTGICDSFKSHPIETLFKKGVLVTINTDNMTVSNINLEDEYNNLLMKTDLRVEDIIQMNINAVKCSFIEDEEKEKMIANIMDNTDLNFT